MSDFPFRSVTKSFWLLGQSHLAEPFLAEHEIVELVGDTNNGEVTVRRSDQAIVTVARRFLQEIPVISFHCFLMRLENSQLFTGYSVDGTDGGTRFVRWPGGSEAEDIHEMVEPRFSALCDRINNKKTFAYFNHENMGERNIPSVIQ